MSTNTIVSYDDNNIFAKILRGEMPCNKVYEDEDTFVFMDIMPRAAGHCLVIPKQAARNILDVQTDALTAVMKTAQKVANACMKAFDCDGITIQQFNEPAGGQVVFHLHVHVIPRFDGVRMNPPASEMENPEVLGANAEKIRSALSQ